MNQTSSQNTSLIKELLIGYCLGCANIIPGVSGGTFLLVFNIYERVFSILSNINKSNFIELSSILSAWILQFGRKNRFKAIVEFLNENDFIYLFKLMIGAIIAIVSLSSLMEYLLVHRFSMTYALFLGLILVSILIPVKMIREKKPWLLMFILLGASVTVYVTWAVNPYDKVERKSNFYQAIYEKSQGQVFKDRETDFAGKAFTYTGKYRPDEYIYASVCGAVSISAMVLPGISGSLVLILMGEYFEVVSAISGLRTLNLDNILFLSCFGLGTVFGGLLFARIVSAVLKRWYDATMAFLIGLMTGSLYALWPFKKSIVMAEQYVKEDGIIKIIENSLIYTNVLEMPGFDRTLILPLCAFATGCLIMALFVKKEAGEPGV